MGKRATKRSAAGGKATEQSRWRRPWRSLCEMEEWKLTGLLFISSLSLWRLCTLVLPCTLSFLAVLGLGVFPTWWPNIKAKAKGTSAGQRHRRSRRKDPIGSCIPWEGGEASAESLRARSWQPHGEEWWEGSCSRETASARELPSEAEDVAERGSSRTASSPELLRSQPSVPNVEELTRSLTASLNIAEICLRLLGKLNIAEEISAPVPCGAMWEEYPVCLQCRRCLPGSCPHGSADAAEEDQPTLAVALCAVDVLVHEEDLQLEVDLCFELAVGGEPLCRWKITQRLPEIASERCCEQCQAPLPRSPGDSKASQASFPVPGARRAWEAPAGRMGLARPDSGAPPARRDGTRGGESSSAGLRPAGHGESLPTVASPGPLPPWAQPVSPAALAQLRRVGLEPLPLVGYRGLGQGLRLQHLQQSWCHLKSSMRAKWDQLWPAWGPAPEGSVEGGPTLPFPLRFRVDALFHAMVMEA